MVEKYGIPLMLVTIHGLSNQQRVNLSLLDAEFCIKTISPHLKQCFRAARFALVYCLEEIFWFLSRFMK